MRIVVRPHQLLGLQQPCFGHTEGRPIILERDLDMILDVLAGATLKCGALQPVAVTVIRMIHPVAVMRHPPGIGLDTHDLQIRNPIEHATKNEGANQILVSSNDRHERVELRAPRFVVLAGQDMETQNQAEIDRSRVEVIPRRIVIVRAAVVGRTRRAGQHHTPQASGRDGFEVADGFGNCAGCGLPASVQTVRGHGAVLGDPPVVGVEHCLLEIDVGMVAQQHANRRVDHLAINAVGLLGLNPCGRVPTSAVKSLEWHTLHRQLIRLTARC